MLVGVPREIKNHEHRVGLLPAGVRELVHHGHQVIVETHAGADIGFDDEAYIAAGATIVEAAEAVFEQAEMVIKVKEPQAIECARLRESQTLFTYLHLAAVPDITAALCASGCTAIAYETVTAPDGSLPLLKPMSVVAGRLAVQAGATSLGIRATNGVVLATEKKLPSTLVDETTVEKIAQLTPEIGITYSGMGPDFRVLTRKARKETQVYYRTYHELDPCSQLVRETATVMQEFTQRGGVRPFGVSLLVAGFDSNGPQLYQVDPSGSYFAWKASAIGKNMTNAKTFLEKRYSEDMELEDAIHTAILTLKEGFDGQISADNIEIGVVAEDKKFRVLTAAEVADYLSEVE